MIRIMIPHYIAAVMIVKKSQSSASTDEQLIVVGNIEKNSIISINNISHKIRKE